MLVAQKATLVYVTGDDGIMIPSALLPAETLDLSLPIIEKKKQLQGGAIQRLCEVGGRACYDSLGSGRCTEDYWKHVKEVGHTSILEHAAMTFVIKGHSPIHILNRKGCWVHVHTDNEFRLTLNARAMLEWDRYSTTEAARFLGRLMWQYWAEEMPAVFGQRALSFDPLLGVERVNAHLENEVHASVYLIGSRGFSHEMVRHRFAMSQRSTRYVDEDESDWVTHPLIEAYLEDPDPNSNSKIIGGENDLKAKARDLYIHTIEVLVPWLLKRNVDKFTARKQARGAARGYLGNALETQMLFTASVADWKHIFGLRLNGAADAEIRGIMAATLDTFKSHTVLEPLFADHTTIPAPDGLGVCLA
jgi:thymidylate synthase ThyX